jgi:type II secretion system protein I
MSRDVRPNAGFTLLEALVALAILGVVLSTVFGIFGRGLQSARRDEDQLLLALVAQNLLARSRLDLFPAEDAITGDIGGGLRWRIEGEPYPLPENLLPEAPAAEESFSSLGQDEAGGDEEGTGGDRPFGQAMAERAESGSFADGSAASGFDRETETEPGQEDAQEVGEPTRPREKVRLRLIRVIVEKGGERFELAGLAPEPRDDRGFAR